MTSRRNRLGRTGAAALVAALAGPMLTTAPSFAARASAAGTVQVRTVPATAGVHLSVDGVPVVTGSQGTAQLGVDDLNGVAHRVTLNGTRLGAGTTVAMTHVSPDPHTTPHVSKLAIGLTLASRVTVRTASGTSTVRPADVLGLRLHSITGQVLAARPGRAIWLTARRAVLRHGALTSQEVTWSVDRVTTADRSAVTTAGPRFDPLGREVWAVRLASVAGTVTVRTVPKVAGVTLGFGSALLTTGTDGTAAASVPDLNVTRDVPKLVASGTSGSGGPVVRVAHVSSAPPRTPKHRNLIIALDVARPVTFRFVDPRGAVVPTDRIQQVTLNQGGRRVIVRGPQLKAPVLLASDQPRLVRGHWRARSLRYTVEAVRVDGANAVFAGRQRVDPLRQDTWQLRLSVYVMTVTVQDALLGRRVASVMALTSPDGAQRQVHVAKDSPTRVASLPRGLYEVRVGVAAFGSRYPVLVSRDTAANLRVITRWDIGLVVLVLLGMAALLILAGRRLGSRADSAPAEEVC